MELAIQLDAQLRVGLAIIFLGIALLFVYRSFYGMRIQSEEKTESPPQREVAHQAA